mmetsp:Transcript_9472/g.28849  ORF Transcript_9472/g.28849 Transcript_9472/m.28849 type:complete len:81 (-) Transcript_9472:1549-1791(-)|eukprot:scaffold280578_cov30-Tisochrysis_lutea.AAC.1
MGGLTRSIGALHIAASIARRLSADERNSAPRRCGRVEFERLLRRVVEAIELETQIRWQENANVTALAHTAVVPAGRGTGV